MAEVDVVSVFKRIRFVYIHLDDLRREVLVSKPCSHLVSCEMTSQTQRKYPNCRYVRDELYLNTDSLEI